jgi:hypothetical protein
MTFDSRVGWWVLGCVIGFIVGYIVRSLREINAKVDEVKDHVAKKDPDDDGVTRRDIINNIALFLVVLLTIWAAFTSQQTSNSERATVSCTEKFLAKTIIALNARTSFTLAQAKANAALQKAQLDFLGSYVQDPSSPPQQRRDALRTYVVKLTDFLTAVSKTSNAADQFPYPTDKEFSDCLEGN